MALIHIEDLSKHFKILNRRPGLSGSFKDLFSRDYRAVKAVDGISFDIEPGEIVGLHRSQPGASTLARAPAPDREALLPGPSQAGSLIHLIASLPVWREPA